MNKKYVDIVICNICIKSLERHVGVRNQRIKVNSIIVIANHDNKACGASVTFIIGKTKLPIN